MACDPNTLLNDAKCIEACVPPGALLAVEIALLCALIEQGGVGGGGGSQITQGRSPAAPDDPTLPALDYPVGGGSLLQWDVPSQTWV